MLAQLLRTVLAEDGPITDCTADKLEFSKLGRRKLDPLHGKKERHFIHDYYNCHSYLPLDALCGEPLVVAYLRPSKIDAAKQAWATFALLVRRLRPASAVPTI